VGMGVLLPTGGASGGAVLLTAVPPPETKIDFASQIGEFWCKLGAFGKFQLVT